MVHSPALARRRAPLRIWATGAEYRRRFGSCMHRRHRYASMAEQEEALFVAWLFIVLQWLVYARIMGQ